MITESFINSCFSVLLCKNVKVRRDKTLFRDILKILEFFDNKTVEVPVIIQSKIDCLTKICDLKSEDREDDNIVDSILASKKFEKISQFIFDRLNENPTDKVLNDHIRQIRLRKKLGNLFTNVDDVEKLLNSIKSGSFESIDDIILDYESVVKQLYTRMMEENRMASIEATSSLDLFKDDYAHVTDKIVDSYDKKNTIPTGYSLFDNEILRGGFEASRIYIFGGGSGSGKSTLLNNLINNAATQDKSMLMSPIDAAQKQDGQQDQKNVFVYITLENTIEESFLRTYQALFNKTDTQVLSDIAKGINLKEKVVFELNKTNSTIIMKYFPAKSISSIDIRMVLDDVSSEYGRAAIKGVYVDYLDLLISDTKYDNMYRLELGDITLGLKSIAVDYNVPLITVTQLGRSVYRVESAHQLEVDQMSESIKKVEHADFIALIVKARNEENIVFCKVAKNRIGKSNVGMEFHVDFSKFKFTNVVKVKNKEKQDSSNSGNTFKPNGDATCSPNSFEGFKDMGF